MGVGSTAGSLPNSTVGGVSVLDVWAGDSPLPRFCKFPLDLASAQNTSQRARGEGRGRATKSRVLGRSGAQRRRGVGGNTIFGSGSRGTSGPSSFKPLKPPVEKKKERKSNILAGCFQANIGDLLNIRYQPIMLLILYDWSCALPQAT